MTATLWILALLLPTAPAPEPKTELPNAPEPRIVIIESKKDGKLMIREMVQQLATETRVENVRVGQQVRAVQRTVNVSRWVPLTRVLELEKVRFYGLDGKKLDEKEVQKKLTRPVPALVSADGKPVDRLYLQVARAGTLVLVLPPSEAPLPEDAPAPPPPAAKK